MSNVGRKEELATTGGRKPFSLEANTFPRFYAGGARIAAFRHPAAAAGPEDWIASTTAAWGDDVAGLSRLPDGRLLRDLLLADPEALLGRAHVARFGSDPALLVKLLDAGERLAVHCHPGDAFAVARLGLAHGKTEAWVILAAEPGATVHVGFRAPVGRDTLAGWVERQDVAAMLAALNPLHVGAGDALLVPAGVPHAIGEGILLLELQQPADLSIMLETAGVEDPFLGLERDVALEAVDRGAHAPLRGGAGALLPAAADPFFRAERVRAGMLDQGFSILVVLDGEGDVAGVPLQPGATVVIPHAAGAVRVTGDVTALRCRPPASR